MAALVVVLQIGAAIYFIADAWAERDDSGLAAVDFIVALALLGGVALGVVALRRFRAEARRKDEALAIARGALGALVTQRFASWNLSRSEAEVALFALKGCTITEIAEMRGSATGTVRSQLSQVYAKAGVTGQPMLISLFLDDLIDGDMLAAE